MRSPTLHRTAPAWGLLSLLLLPGAGLTAEPAPAKEKPAAGGMLVVVDNAGKEHQLKTWNFLQGTTHLDWLAPPAPKAEEPAHKEVGPARKAAPRVPAGPEALVFRDENSTELRDGILTYIPLDRIRSITYDNDKRTVTVRVAKAGGKPDDDEVLTGSTAYAGENKVTIEAETNLGDLGVASVKFQGGPKNGIREIRFPAPKAPAAAPAGRPAEVTIADKGMTAQKVFDLQPLYLLSGSRRRVPTLLFKKTVKIDVGKIKKLAFVDTGKEGTGLDYEVTLQNGATHTLVLLNEVSPLDGKPARLLGLVGTVPAGYKFFPVRAAPNNTFTQIVFGGDKGEGKEEKKEAKGGQ